MRSAEYELNQPNEDTRVGCFWCFAPDYDDCMIVFKKIYFDKSLQSISSEECNIKRIENGFIIEDSYNGIDLFTHEEIEFIIDLYNKTLLVIPNIIYDYDEK